MTLRSRALPWLIVLVLSSATAAMAADDPCTGFKWDITQELALFNQPPEKVAEIGRAHV